MKISVHGFIHAVLADKWEEPHHLSHNFRWNECKDMTSCGYVNVRPFALEFDIADDWNPIPDDIANLRKKQQDILAKAQSEVNEIEHFIGKLSCIEHKPEAA